MDLLAINILVCTLSGFLMMVAVIYMLTYIVGSIASRSGTVSLRVLLSSLIYSFGSAIFLFTGVDWFYALAHVRLQRGMPFYLYVGTSALGMTLIMHVLCGCLTAFLYLRGKRSQGLTLKRVLDSIRTRIRSK